MKSHFTIYCVTNKVNGKRYIGQTVDAVNMRWKEHVSSAKRNTGCRVLGAAIRKHGVDSFEREILETVTTQADADIAETKWILEKQSRVPHGYNLAAGGGGNGYHHEDSKLLIGKSVSERLRKMSPEERADQFRKNIHLWTPKRKSDQKLLLQSEEFRNLVAAGQKSFWEKFTPEERSERVRHQLAGMSTEEKSKRVRKAWADMTPEAREARVLKAATSSRVTKSKPAHVKKMSEWQTAQAKLRTPEQRQEMVLKAWETRRARYGEHGRSKTQVMFSEGSKKGWANMTPEARAERVRKTQDGRRLAKEARLSRLVRINLLSPAIP